jgi:hypothetical protein
MSEKEVEVDVGGKTIRVKESEIILKRKLPDGGASVLVKTGTYKVVGEMPYGEITKIIHPVEWLGVDFYPCLLRNIEQAKGEIAEAHKIKKAEETKRKMHQFLRS